MENIHKFRILNKLKTVYRYNSVENRKESTAEHSWSCLLVADFFLSQIDIKIDKLKVYELLMYHDVVEIEAGNTVIHPDTDFSEQISKEEIARDSLKKQLPYPINDKFVSLFNEFEQQTTIESKFAKAIDALDAEIHELDYKGDWDGWTKEFLVGKKSKYFKEFPELEKAFFEIVKYLEENDYFDK